MAFSYKDVLATRKVVLLGFEAQLFGFAVLDVVLARVQSYPGERCAAHVHHPVFDHNYPVLIWLYFTVRLLLAIMPAPIAYRFSIRLNEMEHGLRLGPDVLEARTWQSLTATLFTNYIYFFGIFLLHGTSAVFFTPRDISRKESWHALWTEWGQSAALIVAVFAMIHVFYSLWKLYRDLRKDSKDEGGDVQEFQRPPPKLHTPDELLFNDKPLQTYEELQANMTEPERQDLWNELKSAFKTKNKAWINDCLDRGCPINWKDNRLETPLHMAGRLGDTSILDRIFLSSRPSSLLERNAANETPLLVAATANAIATIGYLLKEMMVIRTTLSSESLKALEEEVLKCFEMAIEEDKEAALEQLTLWPNWRKLSIGDSLALWYFTGKLWHYGYVMVDKNEWEPQGPNDQREKRDKLLRILIARSAMSDTERRDFISNSLKEARSQILGKFMLEQIPGPVSSSFAAAPTKSRFVIREALRLGLAQTLYNKGTDRDIILIMAARGRHDAVVQDLLTSNSPFPDQILDCAFLNNNCLSDSTRNALSTQGARDWNAFFEAAETTSLDQLKQLLESENDVMRARMLRAKSRDGSSAVSRVVRYDPRHQELQVLVCLDLLFHYGASAGDVDFDGNTALMIALIGWHGQPFSVIKQLISKMDVTQINLPNNEGETVYDQLPKLMTSQYCVNLVRELLDINWKPNQDLDLYSKDANGRIGMQMLEKLVKEMQDKVDNMSEHEK